MRRFFQIFWALWLILPLFGWRSFSAFAWATGDGVSISECVDTLTFVDEWYRYTNSYQGLMQSDTAWNISRGLTSNGHYQFFKINRLFENADSIFIDSILFSYHWAGVGAPNDSDTVLFSFDTLSPVTSSGHYWYSLKYIYVVETTLNPAVLRNIGIIKSPSFSVLRIYRRNSEHSLYPHCFIIFYKKYR